MPYALTSAGRRSIVSVFTTRGIQFERYPSSRDDFH
jgi:hypothetical protein